jgi:hypothetical protein
MYFGASMTLCCQRPATGIDPDRRFARAADPKTGVISMARIPSLSAVCFAAAAFASPFAAHAQAATGAACRVAIDYDISGVAEPYAMDFSVAPGADFVDDFSTGTRLKVFTANAAQSAGGLVVKINYFNDVGVFDSISLDTQLKFRGGRRFESTSGTHVYATSLGVVGNHTTTYSLSCKLQ